MSLRLEGQYTVQAPGRRGRWSTRLEEVLRAGQARNTTRVSQPTGVPDPPVPDSPERLAINEIEEAIRWIERSSAIEQWLKECESSLEVAVRNDYHGGSASWRRRYKQDLWHAREAVRNADGVFKDAVQSAAEANQSANAALDTLRTLDADLAVVMTKRFEAAKKIPEAFKAWISEATTERALQWYKAKQQAAGLVSVYKGDKNDAGAINAWAKNEKLRMEALAIEEAGKSPRAEAGRQRLEQKRQADEAERSRPVIPYFPMTRWP